MNNCIYFINPKFPDKDFAKSKKTKFKMIQMFVDEFIKSMALEYLENIKKEKINKTAENELKALIKKYKRLKTDEIMLKGIDKKISPSSIIHYIQLVLDNYDTLLIMKPTSLDGEIAKFENIIQPEHINCKQRWGKQKKWEKSLSSQIIKAMQYNKIRKDILPSIIQKLNIKSCVYCNATYTITDRYGHTYYDLDHWKPQSHFPYLCTSFFNLQPACPSCNRNKGNKYKNIFFRLWNDKDNKKLEVFRFHIEPCSLIEFMSTWDKQKLSISINETYEDYKELVNVAKRNLRLEDIYNEHKDVIEEIIWKRHIYNDAYLYATQTLLQNIRGICGDDYKSARDRFIIGNYCDPEDVHKRPLSKMTQDIGRQLGIL